MANHSADQAQRERVHLCCESEMREVIFIRKGTQEVAKKLKNCGDVVIKKKTLQDNEV